MEDHGSWFGSLRLRYFGPRPLAEDDRAAEVFNLLDDRVSDIDYYYECSCGGSPNR